MPYQTETLIVGAGLAGSCLAMELYKQKRSFLVIDHPASHHKASMVAAGLINPIIFRYLTLSWEATRNLDSAKKFYEEAAKSANIPFFHPLKIARVFSANERSSWVKKAQQEVFANFIDPKPASLSFEQNLIAPNGFGIVNGGGWLDIPLFLNKLTAILDENKLLLNIPFNFHLLKINNASINYEGIQAKNIVFCEGSAVTNNPYFNHIPFRPVKGELLDLRIDALKSDMIINKDIFLLPLGKDQYKCGSTYDWDDLIPEPTQKGKAYLEEKLNGLLRAPYQITGHQAGIRPAVADRRPVCGKHPQQPHFWILNGLGAKGALLAPYLANQLTGQMFHEMPAEPETDPNRFHLK